jgi:hypothetical protein
MTQSRPDIKWSGFQMAFEKFSCGTPSYLSCLYQFFRLHGFLCRVSVEVEKGSSLGYTVSHEKDYIMALYFMANDYL